MQIVLASLLLFALGIILVYQFWQHSLDTEVEDDAAAPVPHEEPVGEELKAA